MAKRELVIASIIEHQEQVIKDFETLLERYRASVDIDAEDTIDMEDLSRQDATTDIVNNLEIQLVQAENDLKMLKNMDTRVTETVTQGSIVVTEDYKFFISIANHGFEVEGEEFIGLALDAPIYSFMRGKKKGDSFSFNKKEYIIKDIY